MKMFLLHSFKKGTTQVERHSHDDLIGKQISFLCLYYSINKP